MVVVGKGGVGKSTTAAALALRLADAGEPTHLISTDPAHSVGDVFAVASPLDPPRASPCTPRLVLEEFDAAAYARRWAARVAPAVADLVERGTYLDAADARGFLDLSLPGVDEVMAALRLAELADSDARRIVVDTAPTGHTLRLLDAAGLVEGWSAALRAMADKARAVAEGLTHQSAALPAEEVVRELEACVGRVERDILPAAGFVVVTRGGAVVRAEAARLEAELRRRGLRVAAVVEPGIAFPLRREGPRGCDALRALWSDLSTPVRGAAAKARGGATADVRAPAEERLAAGAEVPATAADRWASAAREPELPPGAAGEPPAQNRASTEVGAAPTVSERPGRSAAAELLSLRADLLLFAGKGGVGKTTCAAALALGLAETRDVRLLGTDPAGSLGDVLGIELPPGGATLGRLDVRQIDAAAEFDRLRQRYRGEVRQLFDALGLEQAALDRAVAEALWEMAPPGMDEIVALLALLEGGQEEGRVLVIDPAPTGHFLRLLEMPRVALDWTHALLRVLLKYGLARNLDDLARGVLQLARALKLFLNRLTEPARSAVFVVTLDEPVVGAETERLLDALRRASVPVAGTILNRADTGASRGGGRPAHAVAQPTAPSTPTILAPLVAPPPIGAAALRSFLRRWEFAR